MLKFYHKVMDRLLRTSFHEYNRDQYIFYPNGKFGKAYFVKERQQINRIQKFYNFFKNIWFPVCCLMAALINMNLGIYTLIGFIVLIMLTTVGVTNYLSIELEEAKRNSIKGVKGKKGAAHKSLKVNRP